MLPQEIIRRKRDGAKLSTAEIEFFMAGVASGSVTEGQAAAFSMAVFFRGMTGAECATLTSAMAQTGEVIDWQDAALRGPRLDKHSTGGIGDNVSLVLAPAIAACGGFVPMIAGRGLGHTGGTVDKLEAIPGYSTAPDRALFRRTVAVAGCAIIGQTGDLAPADRRLYAIRDVTATIESIPLITASILSKKLAAGLQGLVMDVKTGSGAFMVTRVQARDLAQSLIDVAHLAGLPTTALITDMNEPLASAAGNAVEVENAISFLTDGRRDLRLEAVVLALGAEMLVLGGLAPDQAAARAKIEAAIDSGAAAERFQRMVAGLGGPSDLLEHPQIHLPAAPIVEPVAATHSGVVNSIDLRMIGLAIVTLGGGRTRPQDRIDPAVGFTRLRGVGEHICVGEPLAFVHARDAEAAERAAAAIVAAYRLGEAEVTSVRDPVLEVFGAPA